MMGNRKPIYQVSDLGRKFRFKLSIIGIHKQTESLKLSVCALFLNDDAAADEEKCGRRILVHPLYLPTSDLHI